MLSFENVHYRMNFKLFQPRNTFLTNRALIAILIIISACTNLPGDYNETYMSFRGLTQGTTYMVKYSAPDSTNYHPQIEQIFAGIDSSMSTYQDHSIISRINRNEPSVSLDEYFKEVFRVAQHISKITDGAFDITVAPLVNAWGFGYTERRVRDTAKIDSLLDFVGYETIYMEDGTICKSDSRTLMDMSGIAQGYTVDVIREFLESRGVRDYLIEVGGEVTAKGHNPEGNVWRVGIDKPSDSSSLGQRSLQAIVHLRNDAIATSGNYRQFYVKNGVKYAHTINPETGRPVKHNLLSVSVFADRCVLADALATAFMVMGMEESKQFLKQHKSLGAYFIYSDDEGRFQVDYTENIKDMIDNL